MTISRILLCTAVLAAANAAHAQVALGISGPITTMDTPPANQQFIYSTQASAFNTGFDANNQPNPRYFDNLYVQSISGGSISWDYFPGSTQAGHKIFRASATVPPIVAPNTNAYARGEIVDKWDYTKSGVRWYAISVFIPRDWQFNSADMIIGQLHRQQKAVASPPVAIGIKDKYLSVALTSSELSDDPNVTPHIDNKTSSAQTIRLARIDDAAARDKWYCFVVRADWSYTPGVGSFKLWMNGALKYEASNAMNAYFTDGGNYVKTGLYIPGVIGLPTYQAYTVYTDYIYTAGAQTTNPNDLYSQTPCARSN